MMSVRAFLEQLKIAGKKGVTRFVTGNQLADMDSVVSAISYAFFYHQKYPSKTPFFPLINISKEDLRLRKDIELALSSHDIHGEHLWFLEDLETISGHTADLIELVLVDHCNLQGELLTKLYAEKKLVVTGIIDHHADEEVFQDANPRIIHSNGSCSSMVFNYWTLEGVETPKDLVELLLAPLLIDTSNMTHKVETEDEKAFSKYKEILQGVSTLSAIPSFEGFYTTLKKAKKDLDGFSAFDLLRKDYKQFHFPSVKGDATVGFSSLGKLLAWILKKYSTAEFVGALEDISKAFHLDVLVMTTSYTKKENDEYTREFGLFRKDLRFDDIPQYAGPLDLNDNVYGGQKTVDAIKQVQERASFNAYNQANVQASRKQVVPIVKDIIESGKV